MSLKKRITIYISLSVLVLVGFIIIISKLIILDEFEQMERNSLQRDMERTKNIIDKEISNLSVTTRDYASWDDTYGFIINRNQEFIDGNIIEQTFTELNLNLMIFMNPEGKIVLQRAVDLNTKEFCPVDSSVYRYLKAGSPFVHQDFINGKRGIVKINSGVMLFASRAILTSDSKGPSHGFVFFGKYFNDEMIKKISDLSILNIKLLPAADTAGFNDLIRDDENNYFWDPGSPDSIMIYSLILDIEGNPVNLIKIKERKDISSSGYSSVLFFISYIILISLIFVFITFYFVRKMFLARLGMMEAENLYKTLFDTSPEAVILCDSDGLIDKLNLQGKYLLKQNGSSKPLNIRDFLSVGEKEKLFAEMKRVSETGNNSSIEILLLIGQEQKTIEFNIALVKQLGDRLCLLFMILRDITEKREIEIRLREDQIFISAIVKASPGFIYIYDSLNDKSIFSNRNIFGYLGYDHSEATTGFSASLLAVVHPEDVVIYNEMKKRLMYSKHTEYVEFEIRLLTSKKDYGWFFFQELVFKRDKNGEVIQILGTAIDISERKETEYALREQTEKLVAINDKLQNEISQRLWIEERLLKNKFILDSIGDAVFTLNEENHVTSFNRVAEQLTGLSSEDVLDKHCFSVMTFLAENERIASLIKKREMVTNYNTSIEGKSGKSIPISISTFLLKNPGNHVSEMIITLRDISELENLRKEIRKDYTYHDIVTNSPKIKKILDILPDISRSDSAVLIEGATGTGKELLAKSIHKLSLRKEKPFVVVNCGAIPAQLMESELFGFMKGAFTDAKFNKTGKIVLADKGTVFFDEVGELPLDMQVKILRLLENFEVEPIGAAKSIKVNIRVVAATNRNLKKMVSEGTFRDDLYYRLNTIRFYLPSLSERKEDIPFLTDYFIEKYNLKFKKDIIEVSSEVMKLLYNHNFPGNIRELEKIIEHAFILCKNRIIEIGDLPEDILVKKPQKAKVNPVEEVDEKSIILKAMEKFNGDKNKVCEELGIHYTTLWRKLKKYKLYEYIKM